jgi:MoxR-like ATPase
MTTDIATFASKVIENVEKVIVGKREQIELLLAAMLCQGHVLLEDVPGTGKTMLARSMAVSMGSSFKRLQCTPDLLPSDITGVSVFLQHESRFEFRPGPLFVNILLADEINRATPRTQSALLEAMQERQVTIDGVTRPLPRPFLVLATQNPVEYEGTFPLPEAQLDRFLLRVHLGYPSPQDEIRMMERQQLGHPVASLERVISVEELLAAQKQVRTVTVSSEIKRYIVDLVNETRRHGEVYLGASPRGSLTLFRTAQARAAIAGREYVVPDDVKAVAEAALVHRLILGPAARIREVEARQIVHEIVAAVPAPGGEFVA